MGKRKITKRHIESEELRKGFEILEETKSNLLHEVYSVNHGLSKKPLFERHVGNCQSTLIVLLLIIEIAIHLLTFCLLLFHLD